MENFFGWATKGSIYIYEVAARPLLASLGLTEDQELELIALYLQSQLSKLNWPVHIRLRNETRVKAIQLIKDNVEV
jgi:hypothetical protein